MQQVHGSYHIGYPVVNRMTTRFPIDNSPSLTQTDLCGEGENRMNTLAERLKYSRARAKISQESLAHKVGVTKANISKVEMGLTENPSAEMLVNAAYAMSVDPIWLITGKNTLAPTGDAPPLRFNANEKLAMLPSVIRDALLTIIEETANASEQRFWQWVKEKEG